MRAPGLPGRSDTFVLTADGAEWKSYSCFRASSARTPVVCLGNHGFILQSARKMRTSSAMTPDYDVHADAVECLQDAEMTEFQDLATSIGWSYREIARRLAVGDATVRQWGNGKRTPPENVLFWLRRIAGSIHVMGLPEGWRMSSDQTDQSHGISS